MTGAIVTFTTQTAGNNSNYPATTAFVGTAIANVVSGETWTAHMILQVVL